MTFCAAPGAVVQFQVDSLSEPDIAPVHKESVSHSMGKRIVPLLTGGNASAVFTLYVTNSADNSLQSFNDTRKCAGSAFSQLGDISCLLLLQVLLWLW